MQLRAVDLKEAGVVLTADHFVAHATERRATIYRIDVGEAAFGQIVVQGNAADFRGVCRAREHRRADEDASDRDAEAAAYELIVLVPDFE